MSGTHPDAWAADKAAKAARYAQGDVAAAMAAAASVLMPGAPVAALVGVACNGGRNENTTGWKSCSATERAEAARVGRTPLGRALDSYALKGLHELGPFGVEAGHAPDPVAADDCPWSVGARAPGVVKVLGREGVTGERWHGAIVDQITIGVWNQARHGDGAWKRLDPRLRWTVDGDGGPKVWTLWPFAVAAMAWSAGDGGAARHINRFATQLAAVPEAQRWGAFLRCAATFTGDGRKHARPSYSALRTAQKLAAGALAARTTGEPTAWFDDGLGKDRAAVLDALVRSALDD